MPTEAANSRVASRARPVPGNASARGGESFERVEAKWALVGAFTDVVFDICPFLAQEIVHRKSKARIPEMVTGVRGGGQKTTCDLVLALSAGFESM